MCIKHPPAAAALKLGSSSRQGLARSLDCHRAALTAGELTIEQGPRYVIIANARQRSLAATAAWSTALPTASTIHDLTYPTDRSISQLRALDPLSMANA